MPNNVKQISNKQIEKELRKRFMLFFIKIGKNNDGCNAN
ncbi:hypothetical protein APA_3771 [Pseudanabaena sp. lw0831]|nr:hypothetical protein APA_3771 [Pseudanabaena sp. lw0831]